MKVLMSKGSLKHDAKLRKQKLYLLRIIIYHYFLPETDPKQFRKFVNKIISEVKFK